MSLDAKDGHESDCVSPRVQRESVKALVIDSFCQAVRQFMALRPTDRRLIVIRFQTPDLPIAAMARKLRISKQALCNRLKRAERDWPAIAAIFPHRRK